MEHASSGPMTSTRDMPSREDIAPKRGRPLVRALLLAAAGVVALPLCAASPRVVNDADTVAVSGNVSPRLLGAVDIGPTDGALPVEKMILVLRPRAGASDRLERLLAEQLDPSSSNYHRWLTPEEYGREFGLTDADLNAVLGWLQRNGFAIDEVAPGRGWINFSGTVAQVETTFRTKIRDFVAGARLHHANIRDPEVPRALNDVQQFRSFFGLPALDPVITVNGPDPGILSGPDGDEGEADLDVEWAGAVAPGATVNLVVSKSTFMSDGVDLSAQYIVDHNLAPIVTYSYGDCR